MSVYIDFISGDEFLSDESPQKYVMQSTCIVAQAKRVWKGAETVIDIVEKFDLQRVLGITKQEFLVWAKGYLTKIVDRLNEL